MKRTWARMVLGAAMAAGMTCLGTRCGAEESPSSASSFKQMGNDAASTLEKFFYKGKGVWWLGATAAGGSGRSTPRDWGADSMIYAAWLRWRTTNDDRVPRIMAEMQESSLDYSGRGDYWSDAPLWDSVADSREYQVLKASHPSLAATALARAEHAFTYVDADPNGHGFAQGAAPTIDFQTAKRPGYKTLESDSNYIKAAILLFEETGEHGYLAKAESKYAAVRTYFLDPSLPLYTLDGSDDGTTWSPHPRLFFSSVNGIMLWNGYRLGVLTGRPQYLADALATAHAIVDHLSDAAGVFESLQAEWDTHEPMVEAMWELAKSGDPSLAPIASAWIRTNATAAGSAIAADGLYDRFFGGIAPLVEKPPAGEPTLVSAWQEAGGFALAFAAADLDATGVPDSTYWSGATYHAQELEVGDAPRSFTFVGKAISLIGTLEAGRRHVLVSLDGKPVDSQVGIQPGKKETVPNTVLFAWRWPAAGTHTIELSPADAKSAKPRPLKVDGYYIVP